MRSVLAFLSMTFLPLFLFWVPAPGLVGFLAGCIGGYLLGRPLRGLLHAVLPAVLLAGLVVLLGVALGHPLISAGLGLVVLVWLVWNGLMLMLGAFVGGLVAARMASRAQMPARGQGTLVERRRQP